MQYNTLIQNIQADIYSNGAELITGDILQSVLLQMVNAWAGAGAMYGGVITPASAAPADLDQATVYLALEAGTYINFVDGGGNPIVTAGPALITYDGGASLVFAKTDLPSGGSGATIVTNDGTDGDSVAIKLTDNQYYKRSFRIDMKGVYTGGNVIQRIGSLIIECFDEGDDICHGYYYGDTLSDILTEVAVYQDDQDSGIFYLMLTHNSDLDSVTFAISPTDGGEVDAFITDAADGHTKVDDANISPVGGGGDGKMGVISQTQTWSGPLDWPTTYQMSDLVYGVIPQANIDLFESAGAVFNETSGYFELNELTDLSYAEMRAIYTYAIRSNDDINLGGFISTLRTTLALSGSSGTLNTSWAFANAHKYETFRFSKTTGTYTITPYGNWFVNCYYLRKVINRLSITRYQETLFQNCHSLEDLQITGLAVNFAAKDCPRLTAASVAYMITNAGTATITITLHATAYARAIADASVQAALQSKTNVSLASA